jgi:hypothetical protein
MPSVDPHLAPLRGKTPIKVSEVVEDRVGPGLGKLDAVRSHAGLVATRERASHRRLD